MSQYWEMILLKIIKKYAKLLLTNKEEELCTFYETENIKITNKILKIN